jgi:hypothetical protein
MACALPRPVGESNAPFPAAAPSQRRCDLRLLLRADSCRRQAAGDREPPELSSNLLSPPAGGARRSGTSSLPSPVMAPPLAAEERPVAGGRTASDGQRRPSCREIDGPSDARKPGELPSLDALRRDPPSPTYFRISCSCGYQSFYATGEADAAAGQHGGPSGHHAVAIDRPSRPESDPPRRPV